MIIRCTRPNASGLISGVVFAPASDGRGMLSEPVDAETAARFLRIPGYEAAPVEPPLPPPPIDDLPRRAPRREEKPA